MENSVYVLVEDPGHGWLAVTVEELVDLKIAHKISGYSYIKDTIAYLEEDCDLGVFVRAYKEKYGQPPAFEEIYVENTPIRNYQNYNYGGADESPMTAYIEAGDLEIGSAETEDGEYFILRWRDD